MLTNSHIQAPKKMAKGSNCANMQPQRPPQGPQPEIAENQSIFE